MTSQQQTHRTPWNRGRLIGSNPPLKPKHIWALATLYRHFPTREALLEALLHATLAELTQKADDLESSDAPDEALVIWFREGVAFVQSYSGVVDLMAAAIADPASALHASCVNLRSAGTRLLLLAQANGVARSGIEGIDLFALIGALGWVGDQPSFAPRADHLCGSACKADPPLTRTQCVEIITLLPTTLGATSAPIGVQ